MYVYKCLYISVYMRVCGCVRVCFLPVCACCVDVQVCVCACVCLSQFVSAYLWQCLLSCVCWCLCVFALVHIWLRMCVFFACICMYACGWVVYMKMYDCAFVGLCLIV